MKKNCTPGLKALFQILPAAWQDMGLRQEAQASGERALPLFFLHPQLGVASAWELVKSPEMCPLSVRWEGFHCFA